MSEEVPFIALLDARADLYKRTTSSTKRRLLSMPLVTLRSKWKRLRARPRRGLDVPARTFWQQPMTVRFPDPVSVAIFEYGFVEESLTRVVLQVVKPGMTIFDVGAHVGYYSLLFSELVGASGSVHSFEPTPSTRALLERNLLGAGNTQIHGIALWSEDGSIELHDYGAGYSAFNSIFEARVAGTERQAIETKKIWVECRRLDTLIQETGISPDVVKIDAESAELQILEGMGELLTKGRPFVTTEVGDADVPGAPESSSIVGFMSNQGYDVCEFVDGRIAPHSPRTRYKHENLLFVPKEKTQDLIR